MSDITDFLFFTISLIRVTKIPDIGIYTNWAQHCNIKKMQIQTVIRAGLKSLDISS